MSEQKIFQERILKFSISLGGKISIPYLRGLNRTLKNTNQCWRILDVEKYLILNTVLFSEYNYPMSIDLATLKINNVNNVIKSITEKRFATHFKM